MGFGIHDAAARGFPQATEAYEQGRPTYPAKAAERLEMARFSISKERTTMLVRIHSVLTPEQRRGLDAIAKRHEAERNRQK